MKKLLLALLLCASPAAAQFATTTTTAPAGDSTNRIASTGFVTGGVNGAVQWNVGANSPVLLAPWGANTNYNAFSLTGSVSATNTMGLVGGATGDPTLLFEAPNAGGFAWRLGNGANIATLSGGSLVLGAALAGGQVQLNGSTSGNNTLSVAATGGIASLTGGLQVGSSANGLQIGTPTGGDKGAGTINPSGGYWSNGVQGVTNANLASMAAAGIKGATVAGPVADLTAVQTLTVLKTAPWPDTSAAAGFAQTKYNPLFFGNAGTGIVHRFNRVFCGEATASSSDLGPVTTKDWLESLIPNSTGAAQFVCVDTTGGLGVAGASRTSDSKTAFGSTSGGSQGGTFYGLNDDVTPSTTPIACGTCGTAIAKGKSSTVTISNASPAVITWTAHGFVANTAVIFTSSGTLPTGLTPGTTYFVIAAGLTTNTFEVSATVGGAAINTSSAGSGTFTGTAATNGLSVNQFDLINAGSLVTPTPFGGVTSGFTGNLFTAGAVTGLPINNVSAAFAVGAGVSGCVSGTCRFEKGSIFFNGSLNTANGAGGNGVMVEGARGMSIRWLNSTPTTDAEIWADAAGIHGSSRQIIQLATQGTTLAQATTGFMSGAGICTAASCPNGAETAVQSITPVAGIFRNLTIVASAPAAGQTLTATWRVNGANTAVTCTITGPATSCTDNTHTVTATANQSYDLQVVTSATTGTLNNINGGVEFDVQ